MAKRLIPSLNRVLIEKIVPPSKTQVDILLCEKTTEVEMNPLWQQKKLRDICEEKGIHITAYSPLGAKGTLWGTSPVMESDVLKQIASAKGKSVAQSSYSWDVKEEAICKSADSCRDSSKQKHPIVAKHNSCRDIKGRE